MRGGPFVLLLLLAACGHAASEMSSLQPGVDVAQAALRGGSPETALQIARTILSRAPGNEAALVVQGDALTELGRLDAARESYAQALKTNKASVGAEVGLGRAHLTDDPVAAEKLFLEALHNDPRNTAALNDLGIARDLQGNHAGAQEAYRQALGVDPQLSSAQVNLALSVAMAGDADAGVRMLRPLASDPGASRKLKHDLAAALAMAGDREEAARILSADLSPDQVRQALDAYAAARPGGPPVAAAPASGVRARPMAAAAAAPAAAPRQPAAAVPRQAVAPVPLAPAAEGTSGAQVQLGALPSENAAQSEWQRLQEQMPGLLAGRQPLFIQVDRDGHSFWRLRTSGFASVSDATGFCQQIRSAGGACMVLQQ